MISECSSGHICFGKEDLSSCPMKDCGRTTVIISPIDIKWFYKIKDLYMIIEDQNIPKDVKKIIVKVFPHLVGRKY
jgi:hypothetical protein